MIIGLVGFIGSGKGTAGDILKELDFKTESFAGLVKDVASVMFNWPRNLLEGDTNESRNFRETPDKFWTKKMGRDFTPREVLQKIGTECGRDVFHKDFWVLALENRIKQDQNYVITDVRFPNEIDWIHSQGGIVLEIQRDKNPSWYLALSTMKETQKEDYMKLFNVHMSEWAWVGHNIDATIYNHGTVEDLRRNVQTVLTNFFGRDKINELLHNGETNEVI